ncbi:MAG: hypothetical protein Q8O33_00865 [Pseudomonadota bacterium]|nr:hypothetical protein [Pseudomonadota bacterium]
MNSIRERCLQAVAGLLAPVAQAQGATFRRSPTTGIPREQSPALLLFPESDGIAERANDRVVRQLVVRIDALAREAGGVVPEDLADRLLVAAHETLFANANLGGLALGIRELDCEWNVEDADATAVLIPARYQITYRTLAHDLSSQG